MKKTVIALCASLLVNLINPAGLKAWGWTELVVSNGKKQAEMIQAEQTGERDSLSVQVQAPCAVLMEASTGQTIYEKNADERRSPASITKIMTLILIFDAIDAGKIRLSDEVVTSAHAKSMGGSQVFLEEGEVQTVETLIKCIVIASGNDASVAMAEYIAGSEDAFVQIMNERAKGLGMTGTHFVDCCGLTESPEHLTTARDIAIMSRELITKYPQIHAYSTIWMENITHVTKQGTKEFGLSNTNKLLKQYPYTTGLKTGSTNKAKYCVCATANKDGVELIAVIMGCPNYKDRFTEAQSLLQFGYTTCKLYQDENPPELMPILVKGGIDKQVPAVYKEKFSWLFVSGEDFSNMEKILTTNELTAPIEKGEQIGTVTYRLNGKELGSIGIYAEESVREAKFFDYLLNIVLQWMAVI